LVWSGFVFCGVTPAREGGSALTSRCTGFARVSGLTATLLPTFSRCTRRAVTEAARNGFWSLRASWDGASTEATLETGVPADAGFAWCTAVAREDNGGVQMPCLTPS